MDEIVEVHGEAKSALDVHFRPRMLNDLPPQGADMRHKMSGKLSSEKRPEKAKEKSKASKKYIMVEICNMRTLFVF